jgi:hypothetical protein
MSDLFISKKTKFECDIFESTRKEKNIPDSLVELPKELVERIYRII